MKMIKEYLKTHQWVLYLIVFIIAVILHLNQQLGIYDDIFFKQKSSEMGIINFISMRYNVWTSRLIIEALMTLLLQLPSIVWVILDSLMYVLVFYSLNKIFNHLRGVTISLLILLLIFLVPFSYFGTAGWYATTTNYLWPLALGLYSLSICVERFKGERISTLKYFFAFVSIIYATNQEQVCALILGYLLLFNITYYLKNKKFSKIYISLFIISIMMLIFHMTCPGNQMRTISEIDTWFPGFKNLTVLEKAALGYVGFFSSLFTNKNIIFLLFLCSLPACVIVYKGKKIDLLISLLPICEILFVYSSSKLHTLPYIGNLYTYVKVYANKIDAVDLSAMSFICVSILSTVFLFSIIYVITRYTNNFLIKNIIFLSGILSKIILGFSPTVFVSGVRTSIYLYYAILVILVLVLQEDIFDKMKIKYRINE